MNMEVVHKYLQDIRDILNCQNGNSKIDNLPNLEIETYDIEVTSVKQYIDNIEEETKIEHKKIVGFFTSNISDTNSQFRVEIAGKHIICDELIPIHLFEKNTNIGIKQAVWDLDIPVKSSRVKIHYRDSGFVPVPYTTNIHFICQKHV